MTRIDWDVWTIDPEDPDRRDLVTCRKIIDLDSGKSIEFVIRGGRVERDSDPDGGWLAAFDSFTIDGEQPTREQEDEYSDDLRRIVWDVFTET